MMDRALPADKERLADEREAFLGSPRAFAACAREFESVVTHVVRGLDGREADVSGVKTVVRRTPTRCIIQLGPVALTLSWVRSAAGRVADGRLMVIEWYGQVAQGAERVPERFQASLAGKTAVILRESIWMAEAPAAKIGAG